MSPSAFIVLTAIIVAADPAKGHETIKVECHGKLRTGIVAVGGETTGTTITFDRITWELQLSDEAAREFAKANDKKAVTVVGSLRQVAGTQFPIRWIVDVEKISTQADSQKGNATVLLKGTLQANDNKDSTLPLMIDAGIKWPVDLSKDLGLQAQAKRLLGKKVQIKAVVERQAESRPARIFLLVSTLTVATD